MESKPKEDFILTHSLLLGERLFLFARLRFLAAAGIVAGSLFATYVVGVEGLDLGALLGAALFLAAYDVAIYLAVRPYRMPREGRAVERRLIGFAHLSILLDYLVLTYAIWAVGGGESPFLAFYLLHAILASVLLSRRAALAHASVGYLLLSGLVVGELLGVARSHHPAGAVPVGSSLELRYAITILFVYGLLTAVTTTLTTGIVGRLRGSELGLRAAQSRIERLADLRRSFLHVVLHDLRSPVATVVAMLEGLRSGIDGPVSQPQDHRLARAADRLTGALDLLRSLRVLADLETERLENLMAPVDLLVTLRAAVDDHLDAAEAKRQHLSADLPASLPAVRAVERLLREAIANYLGNAIKYTPEGGTVVVRARGAGARVRVEVSDNGPGLAEADVQGLFQELSRRGRPAGRSGSGGMGLGLSIVRRIAEAHGGHAGVTSVLGQGSTFFIEIPAVEA